MRVWIEQWFTKPRIIYQWNAMLKWLLQSFLAVLQLVIIVILGDLKRRLFNDHYIHFYEKNKLTIIFISVQVNNLDYIKPEVHKKPDIIIVHSGWNDITSSTKSFENYKKVTDTIKIMDTIKTKLPNCKYAISNVIIRKAKQDIEKKVTEFNSRLSECCSKNKIDIIENENPDGSWISFKKLHLNKKGNSYLTNSFLDFLLSFWFGKSFPVSPKTLVSSLEDLNNLRVFYP